MKKLASTLIATLLIGGLSASADYEDPATYAQDKLLNAEAQLTKLEEQKKAIEKLIKAVKKDLKAAKTRSKAEKLQTKADGLRSDAATLIEQSGVSIELPDFMISQGVDARLAEDIGTSPDKTDLMFKGRNSERSAAFFPGKSGIESDDNLILPPNVREIK